MCRYAQHPYKPHLACFRCRKSWKRRLLKDAQPGGSEKKASCPDCGGDVADMGLDFKPPPRSRVREWALLEDLFTVGITFHSCGCSGPGFRPRAAAQLRAFLASTAATYEANLRHWTDGDSSRLGLVDQRRKAIDYWSANLAAVRALLAEA